MASHETFSHSGAGTEPTLEHSVLRGLTPRPHTFEASCETTTQGLRKTLWGGVPLLMTGTLAVGVGVAPSPSYIPTHTPDEASGATAQLDSRPSVAQRLAHAALPLAHTVLSTVRPDLPATYTVQSGDSVSSIANRFDIPTPAVLTLNALGWDSVVHEGQILKLSTEPTKRRAASPPRVAPEGYIVEPGDSASGIAERLGISTLALLAHNGLHQDSVIRAGSVLRVPGTTVPTVSRDISSNLPILAAAPAIVQVTQQNSPATVTESETPREKTTAAEAAPFDAADLALAEKPALIVVQVPTPAPQVRTPAPAAAPTPAPAPAPAPAPTSGVGQPVTGSITPLNDERRTNAHIIINVGRELGVPDYGIVIALATAMQESSLRNINWGDRDSLGLYQQRPSTGWGTAEQIMDPVYSTRLFFGGPQNPNRGKTRGLLDIAGWQNMALTDAAQRVQISAFPLAYAKWEPSAWAWLYELS